MPGPVPLQRDLKRGEKPPGAVREPCWDPRGWLSRGTRKGISGERAAFPPFQRQAEVGGDLSPLPGWGAAHHDPSLPPCKVPQLRRGHLEECGHWTQMERYQTATPPPGLGTPPVPPAPGSEPHFVPSRQAGGAEQDPGGVAGGAPRRRGRAQGVPAVSGAGGGTPTPNPLLPARFSLHRPDPVLGTARALGLCPEGPWRSSGGLDALMIINAAAEIAPPPCNPWRNKAQGDLSSRGCASTVSPALG